MQFLISKNGTQIGPLAEDEVRQKLANGELASMDLAWHEGLADWQPLGVLLNGGVFRPLPPSNISLQDDGTSGMAIGSVVSGILGLVLLFPGLIAVILGHLSLSQIRKSGGALRGRGMAITGLVLGYLELVLIPIALLAAVALPAFGVIQQMAHLNQATGEARQIVVAAKTYASAHEGRYPASLDELVKTGDLHDTSLLNCSLGKHYPGVIWQYHGAGLKDEVPPKTVILSTTTSPKLSKHLEAYSDGTVEISAKTTPPR